jgi:hypothetical protein
MTPQSAYQPFQPARRPGASPAVKPKYRVLVHRRFINHYEQLVQRVGIQGAQEFWDHVAHAPGISAPTASTCFLRGQAGKPMGPGWSRTIHYEVSSSARIDYQYHDAFSDGDRGDNHPVVAILTINYSSH